jgi:hypothetical protein
MQTPTPENRDAGRLPGVGDRNQPIHQLNSEPSATNQGECLAEHSDVLQRMCDEIERVAWPIDREYEDSGRKFWMRPACDAELRALEADSEEAAPLIPEGTRWFKLVHLISPRERLMGSVRHQQAR